MEYWRQKNSKLAFGKFKNTNVGRKPSLFLAQILF